MSMVWSTDKPKDPGWYWWRYELGRKPTVLYISDAHIENMDVFTEGTLVMFLSELPGEWSDKPLEPPGERT